MNNKWNYGDSYFDGNSYKTRAQAFAAARKSGRGVFTYKGKQYNTMQKGENADECKRNSRHKIKIRFREFKAPNSSKN